MDGWSATSVVNAHSPAKRVAEAIDEIELREVTGGAHQSAEERDYKKTGRPAV
jgi:hypothetical protein